MCTRYNSIEAPKPDRPTSHRFSSNYQLHRRNSLSWRYSCEPTGWSSPLKSRPYYGEAGDRNLIHSGFMMVVLAELIKKADLRRTPTIANDDPRDRSGPGEEMKGTLATVSARNLLSARYLARYLLAFEPMARSNLIWTPNWLTDNRTGRAAPACGIDRCDPLNHLTNSARGTNFLAWQSQAFKWIDHTVCAASNPSFPSGGFPYRLSKAPSNSNSLT